MNAVPIEVLKDGSLRLAPSMVLPSNSRLAVLVLEGIADDTKIPSSDAITRLAVRSGAFDLLDKEPEIYTDADIEPGHHNPDFAGHAPAR